MLALNIATVAILVIVSGFLFFRKGNVLPNKILALILIDPAINFLSNVVVLSGKLHSMPWFYFLAQTTGFAFAPLVHMYVTVMTGRRINNRHPLYIITALGMITSLLFGVEFAFAMSPGEKETYLNGVINGPYPDHMVIVNSVFILLQQVYFTVAAIQVYRYRRQLANTVSSYETTKVEYVTIFISLIWTLNIITIGSYITLPATIVEYIVLPLVLTIICLFILYYGYRHNSIFNEISYKYFLLKNSGTMSVNSFGTLSEEQEPDMATLNSNERRKRLAQKVDEYLKHTDLYKYPELTLTALAKNLSIPEDELISVIRKEMNKSFYDLINEKRVERSQELLATNQNLSVEQVALQSGFNNPQALQRAMKKYRGRSRSETIGQ
jgi:AraC-like DNA-binding protein